MYYYGDTDTTAKMTSSRTQTLTCELLKLHDIEIVTESTRIALFPYVHVYDPMWDLEKCVEVDISFCPFELGLCNYSLSQSDNEQQ
jgi:hypothetical protein